MRRLGLKIFCLGAFFCSGVAAASTEGWAERSAFQNILLAENSTPAHSARLMPGIEFAADETPAAQMTPMQIQEEISRLQRERPSLGGKIALTVVGVALAVVGIYVLYYGLLIAVGASAVGGLIVAAIGGVMIIAGVILGIVGGVGIGAKMREKRANANRIRELEMQLQQQPMTPPPPPPPPSVNIFRPEAPVVLAQF
jgi:hypothetical protein